MKPVYLFGAALLLSTACAGATDSSSGGNTGGGSGSGQLRVLGSDPVSLDPAIMSDTSSSEYVMEVFGGLVTLNRQLKVSPDIAESWTVSPDGKNYTFKLRPGAKFHDGKAVTANDFVYSFERTADPKTGSHTADTYLGDIKGVLDKLAGKAQNISGLKAPDDQTVQLELEAPRAYFLSKMTYPTSFVVDKANVEGGGKNWQDKPNGTGPFKLTQWDKATKITLERNPNYHLEPAKLDKVLFNLAGGNGLTMYENNEIDITGVGITDIERIQSPSDPLNKEFKIGKSLDVWYVGFNTEAPPFDDVKVRQAFAMAVDNQKIITVVLKDLLTLAKGVIPPDMPGYNPNVKGPKFDPAAAKQLLQESKYRGNLPPITLTTPSSLTTVGPRTEAMLEQWKTNLGIDVKVQQVEWATFLGDVKRNPAANKTNKYQMYELGWSADYPDPQDFVEVLFASQSLENNGAYKNAEVDRYIQQARTETDEGKRYSLYQQAEQVIVNEAGVIPLFHGQSYLLVKPYVKGYNPPPMSVQTYRYVSIEK